MAPGSSESVVRQIHRLFNLGTIGSMTDAQLLARFALGRDEGAEAAFEELIFRHGPMVFRVCRSVLRDTHDAGDAFQATRAIHRPDADEKMAVAEAGRVLARKQASLAFALDQVQINRHSRGITAQHYGVPNYPVVVLVDGSGKIAFRSDMAAGDQNVAGVFMKILRDPQAMTEEEASRLVERAIAEEIDAVLKQEK